MLLTITLNQIKEAFENLETSNFLHLDDVVVGCKLLAVLFVLIAWMKMLFESTDKIDRHILEKISIRQFLTGFFTVILIFNYNLILDQFQGLLTSLEDTFDLQENATGMYNSWFGDIETTFTEGIEGAEDMAWYDEIGAWFSQIISLLDPYVILLQLAQIVGYAIDAVTYPVYLIEREFILLLLKIVMPLMLALSVIPGQKELAIKWFKLFAAVFVSGMFLVLVSIVCGQLSTLLFEATTSFEGYSWANSGWERCLAGLVIIFAKVKLYKASVDMSYKIFNA